MPSVLDHAESRHRQPHFFQGSLGGLHLARAAVNEQYIRQTAESLIAVQIAAEPPLNDLLHGGVIVRVGHVLELEMAVVPFQGLSIHMDGHGGHDV